MREPVVVLIGFAVVVKLGIQLPLLSSNPSLQRQTGANAAKEAFGTHSQLSEVIGRTKTPSQFLHAPKGVKYVPSGHEVVVVVDDVKVVEDMTVVLVEVVMGTQSPLSSMNPTSQVQTGISSNREALSAQLHSSVINGIAMLPKHAMHSPKIFLTKLLSQSS